MRRLCHHVLQDLDLSPPFTAAEFCARLGRHRGRPIVLIPRELPGCCSFGALVAMPTKDLIVYPAQVRPEQQAKIIFHEVVHLVCGHLGPDGDGRTGLHGACSPVAPRIAGRDRWWEGEAKTGAAILSALASEPAAGRLDPSAGRMIARPLGSGTQI